MSKKIEDVYFIRKQAERKDKNQTASLPRRPVKKTTVIPLGKQPAKETVDITPLLPYNVDPDGLPTVEELKANPQIIQSASPETQRLLRQKLRDRTTEEGNVRKAQIDAPARIAELRDVSTAGFSQMMKGTAELKQAIENLPAGLRAEIAPSLDNISKALEREKARDEEEDEELPPSYTPSEETLDQTLTRASSKNTLARNLNLLLNTPRERATKNVKEIDRLLRTEPKMVLSLVEKNKAQIPARQIDKSFADEITNLANRQKSIDTGEGLKRMSKSVTGEGLFDDMARGFKQGFMMPINLVRGVLGGGIQERRRTIGRRGRKPQYVREVESGQNLNKHFKKFMSLAKKHKSGALVKDTDAKKLAHYATLNGAGFFDKVWSGIKKVGSTVGNVAQQGIQLAQQNPELAKKAFEVGKSFLKK